MLTDRVVLQRDAGVVEILGGFSSPSAFLITERLMGERHPPPRQNAQPSTGATLPNIEVDGIREACGHIRGALGALSGSGSRRSPTGEQGSSGC